MVTDINFEIAVDDTHNKSCAGYPVRVPGLSGGVVLNANVGCGFRCGGVPVVAIQAATVDHSLTLARIRQNIGYLAKPAVKAHIRFKQTNHFHRFFGHVPPYANPNPSDLPD
jgi:hypothetical protein